MITPEFKKYLANNLRSVRSILSELKSYDEPDLNIVAHLVIQIKAVAELVYPNDTLGILMLDKLSELDDSDSEVTSYCVNLLDSVIHELEARIADVNDGNYNEKLKLLPSSN